MKNLCKRKTVVRGGSLHRWFCLLLLLGFTVGLAVEAGAEYTRPTTNPPTDADLTLIGGSAKTLVINLLNLTPYEITADPLPQLAGYTDRNRGTHKSFMFAPLGIPTTVPGLKGATTGPYAGPNLDGWSQISGTSDWLFTPADTNTSAHPYSFVVSWDDQGVYVTDSALTWTIKSVYPAGHGPVRKDVTLRFWFTRVKPSGALLSEVLRLMASVVRVAVSSMGVIIAPEIPVAWIHWFSMDKELASTAFEYSNIEDNGDEKMYFAAYTIPECTSSCSGGPDTLTPTTSDKTTDAVDAQWGSGKGDYAPEVVVSTMLYRGRGSTIPFTKDSGFCVDESGEDMRIPILNVTLWTPKQYKQAQQQVAAHALLGTPDLSEHPHFVDLYESLNPSQHQTLREAIEAFLRDKPLTHQQEVLVEKIIAAVAKGQTKLSPENR